MGNKMYVLYTSIFFQNIFKKVDVFIIPLVTKESYVRNNLLPTYIYFTNHFPFLKTQSKLYFIQDYKIYSNVSMGGLRVKYPLIKKLHAFMIFYKLQTLFLKKEIVLIPKNIGNINSRLHCLDKKC